jgi:hypothetical protein
MTMTAEFDTAFTELLAAFSRHQDNRSRKAPLAELSDSAFDLYRAQMRTYRAQRAHRA